MSAQHLAFDCPIVPKARPRVTSRGTYMPPKYKACIGQLRESAQAQGVRRMAGALSIEVSVRRPAPRRLKQVEPDVCRPDLDNLVGTVMDALTGLAWLDDCQVVRIVAHKLPRVPCRGWHTSVTISDGTW